ncbi:MAG: MATE family efflux transporter [Kordiimonadaceae bacterium]|nr:MATE family efflux transporter [Kordiimonadaceae bacterium]
MQDAGTKLTAKWMRKRLKRHFSELARLAFPAVMMRIGILGLGVADTAMVGHYATQHLAWLNLANQSVVMFALFVGLGLLSGVMVYTANAFGTEDYRGAGIVWRRTLPFTAIVGLGVLIVVWPSEYWLTLFGQTPEDAAKSGDLIRILALGIPAHLFFVNCTMFLEGIKRAEIGFYLVVFANIVNVVLNYALIFGHWGMPELGAEGSAWASTAVRIFLAITALSFVWWTKSLQQYDVRKPHGQKWQDWRDQRQMGYASATSLASEVLAFSGLAVFAGWLGTVPLAAHGVIYQVLGLPLMISIGIGVATTVRVGIAFSRKDRADTALAGISGIILNLVITVCIALLIYNYSDRMLGIFTDDMRIINMLVPFAAIYSISLVADASQMVTSLVLRGYKETWWPTYLQGFSFAGIMLPACYILAFPVGMGMKGLLLGTLIGVFFSWSLQLARFLYLARRPLKN